MSTPSTDPSQRAKASQANNPSTPSASGANSGATPRSHATPSNSQQAQSQIASQGFLSPVASRTIAANAAAFGKSPKPPGGTPNKSGTSFAGTPLSSTAASKTVAVGIGSAAPSQGSPAPATGTPLNIQAGYQSPAMDALGMNISMSNMGLSSSQMGLTASTLGLGSTGGLSHAGKVDEEERRHRLEQLLYKLGTRTGRVCQESLERLAKRLGLEPAWDIGDKVGDGKLLSFAGNSMVVDVEFLLRRPDTPCRVALQYHGQSPSVTELADAAASIMHDDLVPSEGVAPINMTLDRFAANLERISRMDKLSVPGSSCFEAIDGVYRSLRRIYDHERKAAATLLGEDAAEHLLEAEVMCKRSGSPKMHVRSKVGLQLDYWRKRRLVPASSKVASLADKKVDDAMDLDDQPSRPSSTAPDPSVYSLVIEAEHSLPALYPPIRSSSEWVSERVERPPDDGNNAIDVFLAQNDRIEWQDPPAAGGTDENGNLSAQQPQARFVARLDPPIPIPIRVATTLLQSVGATLSGNETMPWWHKTVLDRPEVLAPVPGSPGDYKISVTRRLPRKPTDVSDEATGRETCEIEFTITPHSSIEALAVVELTTLPFSHPKQFVAVLPILRQYALLASLTRASLGIGCPLTQIDKESKTSDIHESPFSPFSNSIRSLGHGSSIDEWLGTFVTDTVPPSSPSPPPTTKKINLGLRMDGSSSGGPALTLSVPTKKEGLVSLQVDVGLNGELACSGYSVQREELAAGLVRALGIAEDIGVWGTWVQEKLSSES